MSSFEVSDRLDLADAKAGWPSTATILGHLRRVGAIAVPFIALLLIMSSGLLLRALLALPHGAIR